MKEAVARGTDRTQFRPPPHGEYGRSCELEGERQLEDRAGKSEKPARPIDVQRLLQRQPFLDRHGAAERDGNNRRDGHVPEAAGLDEETQDGQAERREPGRGVDNDEARETNGGGCREERVEEGGGAAGRR